MTGPALSIVIPSVNGWDDLGPCVAAASKQVGVDDIEVIVADRVGDDVRRPLRREYPAARLLPAPPGTTIPQLRAMAFRAASAPIVGVIEDHVILPPDWARRMREAHAEGAVVVGGSVENAACDRLTDWAAFLCEYSHCLSPPSAGPADWVTGNNVTYRKELLVRFQDVIDRGGWEGDLHDSMKEHGVQLHSQPSIRVGHKMHYTVSAYSGQRFLYSRSYAALRLEGVDRMRRLLYGLATFSLPPILFSRIVARVWKSRRHRRELVLSFPLLVPFTVAWAAGELVGAWFGAGDALARVR